ncbi:uncharacterized protein LOC108984823 [Juglans regia]|uniref:Uncharacterized protein LOC108984823 n=1 Tax=Juglans regia TaxID=51240 RepID=A0A6P9EE48_JUGRE|nr:uncharacterized protein LOC108984823 [Juglans regia]
MRIAKCIRALLSVRFSNSALLALGFLRTTINQCILASALPQQASALLPSLEDTLSSFNVLGLQTPCGQYDRLNTLLEPLRTIAMFSRYWLTLVVKQVARNCSLTGDLEAKRSALTCCYLFEAGKWEKSEICISSKMQILVSILHCPLISF